MALPEASAALQQVPWGDHLGAPWEVSVEVPWGDLLGAQWEGLEVPLPFSCVLVLEALWGPHRCR